MSGIKIIPVGGRSVYVEICKDISLECNRRVHALYYKLKELSGVEEIVPAYSSLLLIYDPLTIGYKDLRDKIEDLAAQEGVVELKPRKFKIPVVYGGEYGPDMKLVIEKTGLSEDEVIKIHTSKVYTCYMLGFTPGFVYLGDVDDRIAVPRLPTPRVKIPPGSVGIAGKQTGWYGVESPGGWVLIGRTPVVTFDPNRDPPSFIRPGDKVEFYRISEDEYREIREKSMKGEYEVKPE